MDLALLGSEMSTNSLFALLTVYTEVPSRVLAMRSELNPEPGPGFCDTEANGSDECHGCKRLPADGGGAGKLAANLEPKRLASSRRVERSAPRRAQCWWTKAESERRGLEEGPTEGFGDSIAPRERRLEREGGVHCPHALSLGF